MGAPFGLESRAMAEKIVATFAQKAAAAIRSVYAELNNRPVYTVSQVLAGADLKPKRLIGMGGPAAYFIPKIGAELGLPYQVLPHYEAANAIGAAASRPTFAVTLRADTMLGKMVVPELDYEAPIDRPFTFDREAARQEAIRQAVNYAKKMGVAVDPDEIEITEEEVFNMVRHFYTVGKNFNLRAQVKPRIHRVIP